MEQMTLSGLALIATALVILWMGFGYILGLLTFGTAVDVMTEDIHYYHFLGMSDYGDGEGALSRYLVCTSLAGPLYILFIVFAMICTVIGYACKQTMMLLIKNSAARVRKIRGLDDPRNTR